MTTIFVLAMAVLMSGAITVNIPFGFYIGGDSYPAGTYRLMHKYTDGSVIQLADRNDHNLTIFTTPTISRSKNLDAEIVFNRYGSAYFLSEVRWMGSSSACLLPKSPLERSLAKRTPAQQVVTSTR